MAIELEGSKAFRYRIVLSTLLGQTIRISHIRERDANPGIREYEVNFLKLISEVTNDIYKTSIKNGCSQFNDLHLYSSDYFSPIKYSSKKLKKTENTYAIHWYLGSWKPELSFFKKCKNWVKGFIIKIVGKNNIRKLKKKFKRKQDG